MPLYEYRCDQCGESFEMLQRVGAAPGGLTCPRCGAAAVERMASAFAAAGTSKAGACSGRGRFT